MQAELLAAPETALDWATGEVLAVHPAAAVFPLLTSDELGDLAADIAAHGLRMPCVRSADGFLVDGRNRLAACALVEVPPTYTTLPEDTEVAAYVLSLNSKRRHMTKGALAMASVVIRPVQTLHWDEGDRLAQEAGVGRRYLFEALLVQQHAPDLVPLVIRGGLPLAKAHEEARRLRDAATSADAQLRRLQAAAPDLATLVIEERLPLAEALVALDKRERDAAEQRARTTRLYAQAVGFLAPGPEWTPAEKVASLTPLLVRTDQGAIDFTATEARRAAAVLTGIAEYLAGEERANGSGEA